MELSLSSLLWEVGSTVVSLGVCSGVLAPPLMGVGVTVTGSAVVGREDDGSLAVWPSWRFDGIGWRLLRCLGIAVDGHRSCSYWLCSSRQRG